METKRRGRPPKRPEHEKTGRWAYTVAFPIELGERIAEYVESPVSKVKSRSGLLQTAVHEFLDREEKINEKLVEYRHKLEKKMFSE